MFNDEISGMNFQMVDIQTALAAELRKASAFGQRCESYQKGFSKCFSVSEEQWSMKQGVKSGRNPILELANLDRAQTLQSISGVE